MGRIVLYYHAGAANHGCEAIVRATKKIINREISLFSSFPDEDVYYHLDEIVDLHEDTELPVKRNSIKYLFAAMEHHIKHDDIRFVAMQHKNFFDFIEKGDICLSIGGDNYCYKGKEILGYYNRKLHQKGAKTVLWGCSFEPGDMTPEVAKDIALYDLIVAREKISYEVLKQENPNTILLPDPAFQLDSEELPLPKGFLVGHTIGINLSPLVSNYGNGSLIVENYRELIKYILEETKDNIALIPHVVKKGNDDRTVLGQLFEEFARSGRVFLIEDCNCMQLKGYISRCRMFIGARTHATIAAYSTCVPTLVAGYSVKAVGIAREIFGTEEHYVLPVQSFSSKYDLRSGFEWMLYNESQIKKHLNSFIPAYKTRLIDNKTILSCLGVR